MTTTQPTLSGSIPSPMFLVLALVVFAVIGTSIPAAEPLIVALLVIIIAGLLVEGYPEIHAILTGS